MLVRVLLSSPNDSIFSRYSKYQKFLSYSVSNNPGMKSASGEEVVIVSTDKEGQVKYPSDKIVNGKEGLTFKAAIHFPVFANKGDLIPCGNLKYYPDLKRLGLSHAQENAYCLAVIDLNPIIDNPEENQRFTGLIHELNSSELNKDVSSRIVQTITEIVNGNTKLPDDTGKVLVGEAPLIRIMRSFVDKIDFQEPVASDKPSGNAWIQFLTECFTDTQGILMASSGVMVLHADCDVLIGTIIDEMDTNNATGDGAWHGDLSYLYAQKKIGKSTAEATDNYLNTFSEGSLFRFSSGKVRDSKREDFVMSPTYAEMRGIAPFALASSTSSMLDIPAYLREDQKNKGHIDFSIVARVNFHNTVLNSQGMWSVPFCLESGDKSESQEERDFFAASSKNFKDSLNANRQTDLEAINVDAKNSPYAKIVTKKWVDARLYDNIFKRAMGTNADYEKLFFNYLKFYDKAVDNLIKLF